ncbi:MAG: hypothetical protein ACTIM9_01520, partial [Paucilactobacillus nenjiangensis]
MQNKKLDAVLAVPIKNGEIAANLQLRDGGKVVSTKTIQAVLSQIQLQAQATKLNLNSEQLQALLKPAVLRSKTVVVDHGKASTKNQKTDTSN